MCLNSQLYLESLCEDRIRPDGTEDAAFLEYLMEELQVYRDEVYETNNALESDTDDDNDDLGLLVDESEVDNLYIETDRSIKEEPLQSEVDSYEPSANKEPNNTRVEATEDNAVKISKQSENLPKKHTSGVKRKFRPPSPTSYMCYICGNVYNKRATFAYHMLQHNNVKPHECE